MKRIIPEYEFSSEQLNKINSLAKECSLSPVTTKILFARGMDTKEKIKKFLSPSKENFLSPFLMSGMKEAVELITQARDEGWRVAIFGDYDADGICASTILHEVLKEFGIDAYVYVPERSEGYGLTIAAIDKILDEEFPELFITVDCGISNAEQVRYLQECGVMVIVSDHHELPEVLPDCVCVNPKFQDDYPYDNLCGAGVAFKIGVALLGEKAYSLLDFAALATVADSVPLLGENRDIVAEGLKLIQNNPRPCFASLLSRSDTEITAQTLAFTVAPRINAAGRMGDANAALKLFLEKSPSEVFTLAAKCNEYNTERQKCCDLLYESAKEKLKEKGAYGNVILLYDETWNSGFVGIVAARIAEEYCRPTILFVKNGSAMKGSARSIEAINIFNALKNCSEYISEFGGHAQAAGVNITEENFEPLEKALNDYIGRTYSSEDFIPTIAVAEQISGEVSLKFARELMRLEPYGIGHKKPLFVLEEQECSVREIKPSSPHLAISNSAIDLIYFGGSKYKRLFESDVKKQIIFEINLSRFRGKEYVKGFVRDVVYDAMSGNSSPAIFANHILRLGSEPQGVEVQKLTTEETVSLVKERSSACAYGLCLIASAKSTLSRYPDLGVKNVDLYKPSARNVSNTILISPAPDVDLSAYSFVVFLDDPAAYNFATLENRRVFVNGEISGFKRMLERIDPTRETLLEIFAALRRNVSSLSGSDCLETAKNTSSLGFDPFEFIFALCVFEELGLLSFEGGKIEIYRGVKRDLMDSRIYASVCRLKTEKE